MKIQTSDTEQFSRDAEIDAPVRRHQTGVEVKKGVVTLEGYVESIDTSNAALFAASFLRSPLAKIMVERHEPLTFFLPVLSTDCAEWCGVDITISGVTKEQFAKEKVFSAESDRGNGYSNNPHGALTPGDFGVHSHPDTTSLGKNDPGKP